MKARTVIVSGLVAMAAALALGCSTSEDRPSDDGSVAITAHDVEKLAPGERLPLEADRTYRFDPSAAPIDYSRVDVVNGSHVVPLEALLDEDATRSTAAFRLDLGSWETRSSRTSEGGDIKPLVDSYVVWCLPIVQCIFFGDGAFGSCRSTFRCVTRG